MRGETELDGLRGQLDDKDAEIARLKEEIEQLKEELKNAGK